MKELNFVSTLPALALSGNIGDAPPCSSESGPKSKKLTSNPGVKNYGLSSRDNLLSLRLSFKTGEEAKRNEIYIPLIWSQRAHLSRSRKPDS